MGTPTRTSLEPLDALYHEYYECKACPRHIERKCFVAGEGNKNAKVVFVVDRPSDEEAYAGTALAGAQRDLLDSVVSSLGYSLDDVWITNTVLCVSKEGKDPKPSELKACRSRLQRELHYIQPDLVIALGTLAIKSLIAKEPPSLSSSSGRVMEGSVSGELVDYKVPVLITYSLTFLLRNPDRTPGGLWHKFYLNLKSGFEIIEDLSSIKEGTYDDGTHAASSPEYEHGSGIGDAGPVNEFADDEVQAPYKPEE